MKNKNIQVLKPLHSTIPFLKQLTNKQLEQLSELSHIFVFSQNTLLAKCGQWIDFLGVILEGKVRESGNTHQKGYLLGTLALVGIYQAHPINIVGDADGIILAIRIQAILKVMSQQLRNNIMSIASKHSLTILKHHNQIDKNIQKEYQQADERLISKYVNTDLKEYIYKTLDLKQRQKLLAFFPPLKFIQKDRIISKDSPVYLLAVIKGELIVKDGSNKKINVGELYNVDGFLGDYTTYCNIYCDSNDAACLILYKNQLQSNLQTVSFQKLLIALFQIEIKMKNYEVPGSINKPKVDIEWQPFMKNKHHIIELNRKNKKTVTSQSQPKQKYNLAIHQSLFQEMIGYKVKTQSSHKYQHILSIKSQNEEIKIQGSQKIAMLEKQLQIANEKIDKITKINKSLKLDFIQADTKNKLQDVFKQINTLKKAEKTIDKQFQMGTSTLKEVFDEHLKSNKLKALVAKCAYKWLERTRQSKFLKKN